ncbi:DUF4111 domain-containing protein [Halobacillus rhizosphaerae]|uniref:aminoglycoside adenylyltransferase domain-containing protein n=1 Tax=Halobacillus rhizosphaerae TaxID=3064889 RepID=UPI00398AA67B
MEVNQLLGKAVCLFTQELRTNLTGIYLHGSLAMGCFKKDRSDVDLLIVVKEKISEKTKRKLIEGTIRLEEQCKVYPLEWSVILQTEVKKPSHPVHFLLHYSAFHKPHYLTNPDYKCEEGRDPDLTAHLMVTYERGRCLFGVPIREMFKKPEEADYFQAIYYDIHNAEEHIAENPVYYVLNLCRVYQYALTKMVSSKKEGGEWGVTFLPSEYHHLLRLSLKKYAGEGQSEKLPGPLLKKFAGFMIREIKNYCFSEMGRT